MKTAEEWMDTTYSKDEGWTRVTMREAFNTGVVLRSVEIKSLIDEIMDRWKYGGDYISSNDFKRALTELKSKIGV